MVSENSARDNFTGDNFAGALHHFSVSQTKALSVNVASRRRKLSLTPFLATSARGCYICMQLASEARQRMSQAMQIALAILIGKEARQPVVAALDNVLGDAR